MGSLFQKPGQQAQAGASGAQANWQQIMNQLQSYVGQQQQAERGAIAGIGANPYFGAASQMNPGGYMVNPNQTQTFGSYGPGTYLANLSSINGGASGYPGGGMYPGGSPGGPPMVPLGKGGQMNPAALQAIERFLGMKAQPAGNMMSVSLGGPGGQGQGGPGRSGYVTGSAPGGGGWYGTNTAVPPWAGGGAGGSGAGGGGVPVRGGGGGATGHYGD